MIESLLVGSPVSACVGIAEALVVGLLVGLKFVWIVDGVFEGSAVSGGKVAISTGALVPYCVSDGSSVGFVIVGCVVGFNTGVPVGKSMGIATVGLFV
jgi:hypothetical protein